MKSGVKTTEFWGHLLLSIAAVGGAIVGIVPAAIGIAVAGASQVAYQVGRTILKSKGIEVTQAPPPPAPPAK